MNEVNITIMSNEVHIHTGECISIGSTSTDKKLQVVRVLNLSDISFSNLGESSYLPFEWQEIGTNTYRTYGLSGQSNLNPDDYDVFANENNQGLDIQKDANHITVSGGLNNDWSFVIRKN